MQAGFPADSRLAETLFQQVMHGGVVSTQPGDDFELAVMHHGWWFGGVGGCGLGGQRCREVLAGGVLGQHGDGPIGERASDASARSAMVDR
ncbi:hypothetical protein ABGB14_13170 [Nonomuraea sp. B10E15]|uniref:hypothetical protein n=1 Tax=Nonomuraea sp. B10E15 TaxID=3153560 RepID=UPI00325C3FD2